MKTVMLVIGIIGLLAGLLFAGQGAGIVRWPESSFMVNSIQWVIYGLILAGIGLILIGVSTRRSSRQRTEIVQHDPDTMPVE